jgi:hypothetical protein
MTEVEFLIERIAAAQKMIDELQENRGAPLTPSCSAGIESVRKRLRQHEERLAELLKEPAVRIQRRKARTPAA